MLPGGLAAFCVFRGHVSCFLEIMYLYFLFFFRAFGTILSFHNLRVFFSSRGRGDLGTTREVCSVFFSCFPHFGLASFFYLGVVFVIVSTWTKVELDGEMVGHNK